MLLLQAPQDTRGVAGRGHLWGDSAVPPFVYVLFKETLVPAASPVDCSSLLWRQAANTGAFHGLSTIM